ncbi:hypothetical protein [Candidatus Hodgkinia cicadicola]
MGVVNEQRSYKSDNWNIQWIREISNTTMFQSNLKYKCLENKTTSCKL